MHRTPWNMYVQADQAHDFPVGPYGVVPGQNANPGVDLDSAIFSFFPSFFFLSFFSGHEH